MRKCIGDWVVSSFGVSDICSELCNVIQVADLMRSFLDLVNYTKVSGLWSVVIENWQPSIKWWKCLITKYTARNSLSNVLYFVSAGLRRKAQDTTGCWWTVVAQPLLHYMMHHSLCCRVGMSGFGCTRRVVIVWLVKAWEVSSVHWISYCSFLGARGLWSGRSLCAQCRMKWWIMLTRLKNSWIFIESLVAESPG